MDILRYYRLSLNDAAIGDCSTTRSPSRNYRTALAPVAALSVRPSAGASTGDVKARGPLRCDRIIVAGDRSPTSTPARFL